MGNLRNSTVDAIARASVNLRALLNGSTLENFAVKAAIAPEHAVRKDQLGVVSGFSNTNAGNYANFTNVYAEVVQVQVTLTKTSTVMVTASMDAYCGTAGKSYRVRLNRGATVLTAGPYCGLDSTAVNNRSTATTSAIDASLAPGTYTYYLYAANTADSTTITVGDVVMSILAIPVL